MPVPDPRMAGSPTDSRPTSIVKVADEGDLFGRHANPATLVTDKAAGGKILVSSAVSDIIASPRRPLIR